MRILSVRQRIILVSAVAVLSLQSDTGVRAQTREEIHAIQSMAASNVSSLARSPIVMHGSVAFTQPFRTIELAAAEPGRVAKLNVRRGSHVRQGDLLVELDTAALKAARSVAEQRSQSTARKEALEVELARKLRMLEKMRGLRSQGAGTPEELLDAESEARIARLNVREADEALERARLEVLEIDAKMELRRVRAKMDGVIIEVHREVGEYVAANESTVATLVDLTKLRASFFLPTDIAQQVDEGDKLPLQFASSGTRVSSMVEYVGPLTHADSGRVRVDVLVENADGRHQSGVQCMLPTMMRRETANREVRNHLR